VALTVRQLNRTLLERQLLASRAALSAVDAARAIVAIQAQEPASPYIALWNRLADFDPVELDRAFSGHEVVKASLMRMTLHVVHAGDYTTFHEAMLANLRASRLFDRRFRSAGLTPEDADALVPQLLGHTASDPRTAAEIQAMFADHLEEAPHERIWWALRTFAPIVHAVSGGPWSFGRPQAFRAAPTQPARVQPGPALQRLAWRYLEGFGPASARDFAQFALQRQPEVKATFAALSDDLVALEGPNGEVMYDVPGSAITDPDAPATPRLLPMWDSTLLAHFDRSRVISDEYRSIVIRRNGDVLATILVDGWVAGVWRTVPAGIEITAFRSLDEGAWDGLEAEARGLLDFLSSRDPTPYKRFNNWWKDLPAAEVRVVSR
jgi:hypothetical protein